jgi:hypothetical protein
VRSPKSRLLDRLDAALPKARSRVDAACLRAERAGFLARHGMFDEAEAELKALQAQFDDERHAAVSVWLCIVEGWLLHFRSLSGSARDKMKRAQALSAAAGLAPLHALSSAWLAHMDYMADDVAAFVCNASLALQLAAPDHHSARARACLVVALGYDFAERGDRAQAWYARSREHSTADGDETALSALSYNISSHRVHHAMQAAVFGGDVQGQARYALASSECTGNFDAWIGATSLDALVPMQRAAIASLQGHHGEALALYERHLADAQRQGLGRLTPNYLADIAWCRWHLGDKAGALRDARTAAAGVDASAHPDDLAMAHGRLGVLFKLLDDDEAAVQHSARGRECWAAHRAFQASVFDALEAAQLHS